MDLLQSLLALMTPIGLALFALVIVREGQKDRAAENTRRDQREAVERDQRAKDNQQFMLLFATLSGKQETTAAAIVKSGVDSESRVTSQVVASEMNIKGRVSASGDATTAAIVKLSEMTNAAFQILLARPPDPTAAERFDKAMAILTAQVVAVADDLKDMRADVASNTEVGAANTTAITDAATALAATTPPPPADVPAPASVIIADVSDAAIASTMDAVTPKADDDSEIGLKEAS